MEAVRPRKTKAKTPGKTKVSKHTFLHGDLSIWSHDRLKACVSDVCSMCLQRKQVEDNSRATAPPDDEATSSEFTDIPLSLPYQSPEEERPDPQLETLESHPSDELETSSSHVLSASLSNAALQSNQTKPDPVDATGSSKHGGVVRHDEEPKATEQTTEVEKDTRLRNQPIQFLIQNAPTAPALYPSVPTLEESSLIHLCEENVKNSEREPAVLALPEQETSPPSLQPLESVAEISRSKLYPELPKIAPEMQVI